MGLDQAIELGRLGWPVLTVLSVVLFLLAVLVLGGPIIFFLVRVANRWIKSSDGVSKSNAEVSQSVNVLATAISDSAKASDKKLDLIIGHLLAESSKSEQRHEEILNSHAEIKSGFLSEGQGKPRCR